MAFARDQIESDFGQRADFLAKTRSLLAPKVVTAIVGVLLNMLGAAWFSVSGVVGAGVVASAVYLLWILHLVRTRRNQSVGIGSALPSSSQNVF